MFLCTFAIYKTYCVKIPKSDSNTTGNGKYFNYISFSNKVFLKLILKIQQYVLGISLFFYMREVDNNNNDITLCLQLKVGEVSGILLQRLYCR